MTVAARPRIPDPRKYQGSAGGLVQAAGNVGTAAMALDDGQAQSCATKGNWQNPVTHRIAVIELSRVFI
jgi:hypothetical protein